MDKDLIYIEYKRKSSEAKERQVASLKDQHAENVKIEKREGLYVKYRFYESRSAFKPHNRPDFDKAIEYGFVKLCEEIKKQHLEEYGEQ